MKRYENESLQPGDRLIIQVGAAHTSVVVLGPALHRSGVMQYRVRERRYDAFDVSIRQIVYILEQHESFVGTLWAGGWDDYVVDNRTVRLMTMDEVAEVERSTGKGLHPNQKGWLLGIFCPTLCTDQQSVQVIAHIGGGN
jgi:hypothetical protein